MDSVMHIPDIRIEIMGYLSESQRWALYCAFRTPDPLFYWPSFKNTCNVCWTGTGHKNYCELCKKRLCKNCVACVTYGLVGTRVLSRCIYTCDKCAEVMKPLTIPKKRQPAIKRLKFEK